MFDKDEFVTACLEATRSEDNPQQAVRDLVGRAVSNPLALEEAIPNRTDSPMMTVWHRSDELTALHIVWPPGVDLFAHDHNMWAVIGLYGGREDNSFYRRLDDGRIAPHTARTLLRKDVIALGSDVVHSVANPTREWTAALHVYGGEFFSTPRTMWDKERLTPVPLDVEWIRQQLENAAQAARDATAPGTAP